MRIEVDRLTVLERSGSHRPRIVANGRVLLAKATHATLIDQGGPGDMIDWLTSVPLPPRFDVEAEAVTGERFIVRGCRPTVTMRMGRGGGQVASCRTVYGRG